MYKRINLKLFKYDDVTLIELVESKPCLWDKTTEVFKDSELTDTGFDFTCVCVKTAFGQGRRQIKRPIRQPAVHILGLQRVVETHCPTRRALAGRRRHLFFRGDRAASSCGSSYRCPGVFLLVARLPRLRRRTRRILRPSPILGCVTIAPTQGLLLSRRERHFRPLLPSIPRICLLVRRLRPRLRLEREQTTHTQRTF